MQIRCWLTWRRRAISADPVNARPQSRSYRNRFGRAHVFCARVSPVPTIHQWRVKTQMKCQQNHVPRATLQMFCVPIRSTYVDSGEPVDRLSSLAANSMGECLRTALGVHTAHEPIFPLIFFLAFGFVHFSKWKSSAAERPFFMIIFSVFCYHISLCVYANVVMRRA